MLIGDSQPGALRDTLDFMPRSASNVAPEPAPARFFEHFAWAVPSAFAGALAGFRFEQGDVLYRSREAYGPQSDATTIGGEALQVLLPKRSGRTSPTDAEGDRRTALWQSAVVVEKVGLAEGKSESLAISQGKLLMTLWTGDEAWLDPNRAEPPVPLAARELAGRLDETLATFESAFRTRKGAAFLFVVDLASDASRTKAASIEDALTLLGRLERIDRPPAEAGLADPETFHPALAVRGLAVAGVDSERLQTALRGALYGGAQSADDAADDEAAPDRFSVARHGRLVLLGED